MRLLKVLTDVIVDPVKWYQTLFDWIKLNKVLTVVIVLVLVLSVGFLFLALKKQDKSKKKKRK